MEKITDLLSELNSTTRVENYQEICRISIVRSNISSMQIT